ncbi:phospholipase D family protein [Flavobacterium chungangensis]|uniref:Phospholipase D family protein n=1 Tax=Flavobacterium chungangensis TaxID=2708132 RepID=A0ABV8ZHI6_9FLAO
MILNLEKELGPALKDAKAFFIATALISRSGYEFIEKNKSSDCKCNYVIGLDLAVNPQMLKLLLEKSNDGLTKTKVCKPQYTFHPKVYLIEQKDGRYVAFIGSANTTQGGLSNNLEMTVKIDSQDQCGEIRSWFKDLYESSMELDADLITQYSEVYNAIRQRQRVNKADFDRFRSELPTSGTIAIDLEKQYFGFEDFEAFSAAYQWDKSNMAKDKRKRVKLKFLSLHDQIYKRFTDFGLNNLHCHSRSGNIVSSHAHTPRSRPNLDAMWLHYGTGKGKLFDHPRLQIILRGNEIGIWLMIGKNRGSRTEREKLRSNLNNEFFVQLLHEKIKDLGGSYWIDVKSVNVSVSKVENAAHLKKILLTDDFKYYFTIGRNFNCTDIELSEENFPETVLFEFHRLGWIYDFFV